MARQRRLLCDENPELEAIYHPDNEVPFREVPLTTTSKYLWRCRSGHEDHVWDETASSRRSLKPAWKARAGGSLACPWCERLWVKLACGHVRRCKPGEAIDDTQPCLSCRRAVDPEYQAAQRERVFWDTNRKIVKRAVADLERELTPVTGPDVLTQEVRYRRRGLLQKAVYARLVHDSPAEEPKWIEAANAVCVDDVMPSIETCRGRAVVPLSTYKSAWGPGLAHHLGDRPERAPVPDGLGEQLRAALVQAIEANGGVPTTKILTHGVKYWSRLLSGTKRHDWVWMYRELTVPVRADGASDWGRVDCTLSFPAATGWPDVVIEIDQTNKDRSVEKLSHVRDAGGIPVWVRWGTGPVAAPDWLPVVDLTGYSTPPGGVSGDESGGEAGQARR